LVTTVGETSNTQVALLHRISSIVSSDQDIESVLQEMVSLTMNVTHSDACLVYLIDYATNEIVLRASQLPHDAEIGKVRLKMGEGITGWVAAHNSVVALARHASADSRFKPFSSLQEDTYEAFLSVPLVEGGEIIGVINVHHKEPHQHGSGPRNVYRRTDGRTHCPCAAGRALAERRTPHGDACRGGAGHLG
jgi:uroporphyrinogen-III synthase